ncbi:SMI1/KNR4 family protein [Streptomyces sp. NPDC058953]|uniref:SMI1/KNR4 family protein n=1 Tax=unclassified Streptomyces TaxID=2593676 RepID=UPI003681E97F
MEELVNAVGRATGWAARGAAWLWDAVGPTPDEERDPSRRKERLRYPNRQRPLTGAELAEAEAELGVALPAEYRAYLLDPPEEGLLNPLTRTPDGWRWTTTYEIAYDLLATDFPHPDSYKDADYALCEREPKQDDFPDPAAFDVVYIAWDQEVEVFERRKKAGAVVILDGGCGFSTLLAVTGPLRGTMWFDDRAATDLILPLKAGDRVGTFAEWLSGDAAREPW